MRRLLLFVFSGLFLLEAQAQETLKGRVLDARDNTPLQSVNISVKGAHTATTTDQNGAFSISVSSGATLVFSAVGYAEKEVVAGTGPITVNLDITQKSLQEVVITGYTVQNKRQVAGSVAKLSGDEIKMQPVGSFDKALQGKVAGVLSISSSGQPGSAAEVTIRGKGSINGTNRPLYIIDGVQVNSADFATINPGDIESFTILKDASSTAIYGSRGANGVIVITTKRGHAGQTQVNYDFQYGWSQLPENKLALMNSAEKLQYEFYDRPDYGSNPNGWTPAEVDSLSKLNYNIENILFRKGITQQHQVSASGGNEKTRFYLSGSIFDQEGIVITTGLKRYTGRFNIDNNFNNWKIGLSSTLGYSRSIGTLENDEYIGSPLNAIRWFNPYMNLYDANGNYQEDYIQDQPNPLRELLENNSNSDQLKGIGSAYVEFAFPWVKGLKARTNWGADFTENETFGYLDRTTDQGSQSTGGNGQVSRAYGKTFRYTGTTSLSYQKISGDHDFNVALYNEVVQSKSESFGFTGFGLVGPFKNEAGITPGTGANGYIPTVTGSGTQNGLVSYFLDGTYGFKKKYYFQGGIRRDGSSRLRSDQRWANFYHVGLSWIMSDESFLKNATWLNSLKYKVSYGTVGSQGIGDFTPYELLSATTYNGIGGLVLTNLERPLTWETKRMFNTGIEFTVLKNKLSGTVEVYNNTTVDLFLDRQLSRTSGYSSVTNNLGQLRNRGIEATINLSLIRNKNFSWSIDANYAHNDNELLDQNGQDENVSGTQINKVGLPINSIYLVRYAGVDPQTGDALYYSKDGKSKSNVYDPKDRVVLGPTDQPNFGGFSTNFNYKGVELDVLFSYAWGGFIYNNDRQNVENPIYWYSNLAKSMLREWQQPGDVTDIPSPYSDFHSGTSRFVEKADFLRLRNVMLAYNLPASVLGKVKIRSAKIFAQGQNLYVWHNFLGYDPEVVNGFLSGSQYPQLKTVTFGLSVGF